jgi:hypothetical protein
MGSSGRNSQRKSVSVKKKTVKNFFAHPRSSGKNCEEASLPRRDGKEYRHISGNPPEKTFPPERFPEPQSKPCHAPKSSREPEKPLPGKSEEQPPNLRHAEPICSQKKAQGKPRVEPFPKDEHAVATGSREAFLFKLSAENFELPLSQKGSQKDQKKRQTVAEI